MVPPDECVDNEHIPDDLIRFYMKDGQDLEDLKCPPGTTSARGSYCLGHCKKTLTTDLVTDTVNPVSSSEHIDLGENAFGED